jgi:MFS family permease
MYGFRKPFTAASYENYTLFGMHYKVVLVIAQVIGYMLSKFLGIRIIAGMRPERRAGLIIVLIFIAWGALLLFGLVPPPYNFVFMFINGLPLGMVWGLVVGYIEGRRTTELMAAVCSTSFIFASGWGKTIGKSIVLHGVSETWMPFVAGGVFVIPLLICTWMLNQTPPPTAEDIAQRTIRLPMGRKERRNFLRVFALALAPTIVAYVMLTILRDFTEDFANELWSETGYGNHPEVFGNTSTTVGLIVLAVLGGFFLIRNNYKAFQLNNVIVIFGFLLAAGATLAYRFHLISPVGWIVTASTGLYLGYVPYNCFYFERMLAAYRISGNVGFLIYIADAFGYLGTVVVLIAKEFVQIHYTWVDFFTGMFYISAFAGILLVLLASTLFTKIYRKQNH